MTGRKYPDIFVRDLCTAITPGVRKILEKGELPGGGKRGHYGHVGGAKVSK